MEEVSNRIKSGIEFLKAGLPFKVGDLYWGIDKDSYFNVTGVSKYIHFENITKGIALAELSDIKSVFFRMVDTSTELNQFIKDRKIKFNLDYDYGMGDIRICSEIDGVVNWHSSFK